MISIVMTVYNVENHLEKAINSVLNQEYSDIELILVNDCSTDNSVNIINLFSDSRIKYISNEVNMGAGYSRKVGIESALGEYIITIDGDDWVEPDFLKNLYYNSENCDMVFGSMVFDFNNGDVKYFDTSFGIFSGVDKLELVKNKKIIFLNTCLVKRELYDKVSYDTKRYNEDTPTLIKLLCFSDKIKIVKEFGYHYIQHNVSLCSSTDVFYKHLCLLLTTLDIMDFFDEYYPNLQNFVSVNDLFIHMSYLTDENLVIKHQDLFNTAMLKFFKRIHRE